MLTQDSFKLKRPIGTTYNVDQDDVLKTKTALQSIGDYEPPEWGLTGYPDDGMFAGLKKFQKREGLAVDGIMKPGGPTEERLGETLRRSKTSSAAASQRDAARADPKQPIPLKIGDDALGLPPSTRADRDRTGEPREAQVIDRLIGAGAQYGPQILRALPSLLMLNDKARENAKKTGEGKGPYPPAIPQAPIDSQRHSTPAQMEQAAPPPPTPGFEPPDDPGPDREEFPMETKHGPTTEIFPNPGEREAVLETFPKEDSLGAWILLENSRGNEETQAKTDTLIKLYHEFFKRWGLKAIHKGGGHSPDDNGTYSKERFIPSINGVGAARPDGSFKVFNGDGNDEWVEFNTVDNLRDGRTPSARERRALAKIRRLYLEHEEKGDIAAFPKLRGMNIKEWEAAMRPLLEEYFEARWGKVPS